MPFMPTRPPARARALSGAGRRELCVLRGALRRATRELRGLQGLRTVWGSEVPGVFTARAYY